MAIALWWDESCLAPLDLQGLELSDTCFRTLPRGGFEQQLDFLVMSCHNPETAVLDGENGFAVWAQLPDIIAHNKNVRFALLIGDQIYADDVERKALREKDPRKRVELYLGIYRKYWSDLRYRRVLCQLPAYLMWDDHDITDGWGSREDSFEETPSDAFKASWQRMFHVGAHGLPADAGLAQPAAAVSWLPAGLRHLLPGRASGLRAGGPAQQPQRAPGAHLDRGAARGGGALGGLGARAPGGAVLLQHAWCSRTGTRGWRR